MSVGTKPVKNITNIGTILQAIFADLSAVIRVAQAGLDWTPKGDLTNAVRVGENTPVMLYNSTGGVLFVAFGDQSMSAPTGATDGIPIAAGEKFVLNSGAKAWVRGSAAGIFAYNADLV
jgi:hypothetical protein